MIRPNRPPAGRSARPSRPNLRRRAWFRAALRPVGVALAVAGLAGCEALSLPGLPALPLSALHPEGLAAHRILTLTRVLMLGFGAMWGAMILLFLAVAIRPARFRGVRTAHWALWGGVVLPLVVTVPLFVWAAAMTHGLWPGREGAERIDVEAYQWGWHVTYPSHPGAASESILYLPAGREVALHIRSRDVVHAVWIPRLAGKLDATPGHVAVLRLTPDRPGILEGECAEFCGLGHTEMRFVVDVREPAAHEAALAGLRDGTTPASIAELDAATRNAAAGAVLSRPRAPTAAEGLSR